MLTHAIKVEHVSAPSPLKVGLTFSFIDLAIKEISGAANLLKSKLGWMISYFICQSSLNILAQVIRGVNGINGPWAQHCGCPHNTTILFEGPSK